MKSKIVVLLGLILRLIPLKVCEGIIKAILHGRLGQNHSVEGLKTALRIDNTLYGILSQQAVSYGQGNHVKHRLTGYIEKFSDSAVTLSGPYLDIGCNAGVLTHAIAQKTKEPVTGIEIVQELVDEANRRYSLENLDFVAGDATQIVLPQEYKTIVLSNVWEHIAERVEFLKKVVQHYKPETLLIRVPIYERDWRVPLKKELDVEWRLDQTHEIEHTLEEFNAEISASGLSIEKSEVKWGEIWAVVKLEAN